jgi:hypothetical protein
MSGARRILSTLFSSDPPMDVWRERVDMLRPLASDSRTLLSVLARAPNYDAIVLDGSTRRDQIAAALLRARRSGQVLVVADSTWKTSSRSLEAAVERRGVRMIDSPATSFCVLSTFETWSFPATWGLRSSRVCFTPWPSTLAESAQKQPSGENGRIFAGGNSLRNYSLLIAAAGAIDAPIDIATSVLRSGDLRACPENVTAQPVPQPIYDAMMASASIVVVPLQARVDRSSGQTTYVNAMAQGKAIVVTDVPGVRDYIIEGETGLIVAPGDSVGLARAVQRLLDDPSERIRLGRAAREYAAKFLSLDGYATRLLEVVDEALATPAPPREANGGAPKLDL